MVKVLFQKRLFKRPLRLLPFLIEGILIAAAEVFLTGVPPMGRVTLTAIAALAAVLINNRYSANELKSYLKEQIERRTEELRVSEERYRTLVNNIPGVAYRSRYDEHLTMLFMSDEIERLTGYPSRDFIGNKKRSYRSILHPDNPDSLYSRAREMLENNTAFNVEYRILDCRGRPRWILDKGAGVRDEGGKVRFIDGVLLDITEEKRLAQEKEKWEEHYRQSQKMESIGRLAGGIAHDLNNLLTPVLGYAELAHSLVEEESEAQEYIDEISGAAKRARDLVQQLLTYSRGQKVTFADIDLNRLIEDFDLLLRKAIREDIALVYRKDAGLPPIKGNRNQLEQVIMNLAVNSQDAMPGGGEITIETSRNRDKVVLMISDTGKGMDKETEEHIFEPFFTTKGTGGTGLGLATVYGIIQQHKGVIRVKDRPERGTAFHLEFPMPSPE